MKYPNMYEEVRYYLQSLADVDYQKRVWVKREYPPGIQLANFDLVIHFLFDDTQLAEDPESTIGWYLRNKQEALAIKKVTDRIDKILDDNDDLTDEEYIALPEWEGVVKAAQEALEVFEPLD